MFSTERTIGDGLPLETLRWPIYVINLVDDNNYPQNVYLGLVGQSFGKRILINLNMYTVKLKFLRRETVLRQILKTNEKKQKN